MNFIELNALPREKSGKETSKKLRRQGMIPAVIYGKKEKNILVSLSNKELEKVIRIKGVPIFKLKIENNSTSLVKMAIIKEYQRDPLKDNLLHVDFLSIDLKEKLKIEIPIRLSGDAPGVKEGGILQLTQRELTIECLPTEIPKEITVDISNLKVGDVIHVKDIIFPEGVTCLTPKDISLVTVQLPKEETETTEGIQEPVVIGSEGDSKEKEKDRK